MGPTTESYLARNVLLVLEQLSKQCATWHNLPLSPAGRGNLIKSIYLTKLLTFFRQTSTPISQSFFLKLDSIVTSFIWAGRPPRVARRTLYIPLLGSGLALPNFLIYYWVLVTVR